MTAMNIADRMSYIPFSGIRKVFEKASRRENLGEKIFHLEIGRPDFDTPLTIKEMGKAALDDGKVHYTTNYGVPELRETIAIKLERDNNLVFNPATEIIVTVGTSEALFMAMMALLNPKDEVLIPDPCWPHYFYCARMAGAVPISVSLKQENLFIPDIDDFKSHLTSRTRMIIVNTPHNPTGAVYPAIVLKEIAQFAAENNLFVLSDEIYEKMLYDDSEHVSIGSLPEMKERTITLNGLSKIYSMTGWRIGYVAANKDLIEALVRIHQYTTICATTFAQWGAAVALSGPQGEAEKMVREFDRRRKLVFSKLNEIPGVQTVKPKGAFYFFPSIKNTGRSAEEIANYLLEEVGVVVVPGSVFGEFGRDFLRLSYACSYEDLDGALARMKSAFNKLGMQ
jgi:aspartate/methionine/tyrosine aminotransferase